MVAALGLVADVTHVAGTPLPPEGLEGDGIVADDLIISMIKFSKGLAIG